MKKIVLFIIILNIFLLDFHAQNISLTFNSSGSSAIIDSIIGLNQTTNEKITVLGNVFQLTSSVSTGRLLKSEDKIIAWPNPFHQTVNFTVPVGISGEVNINVLNSQGQILVSFNQLLEKGKYQFSYTSEGIGLFIIKVQVPGKVYNYKIFCQTNGGKVPELKWLGQIDCINNEYVRTKSAQNNTYLSYTPGDRILFIVMSGNSKTVFSEIPLMDKSIDVDFFNCSDADNNNYSTVKIGTQIWMAENLKTTKYNDGNSIPLVTKGNDWYNLRTPAYCYYGNDNITNKAIYGALYNWYAVNTGKLCPSGWHVPNFNEWLLLRDYLKSNGFNYDTTLTLNKVGKSLATASHWNFVSLKGAIGNTDFPEKRNASGFSALPAGYRYVTSGYDAIYQYIGIFTNWWASSYINNDYAHCFSLYFTDVNFIDGSTHKTLGLSVRCVKD